MHTYGAAFDSAMSLHVGTQADCAYLTSWNSKAKIAQSVKGRAEVGQRSLVDLTPCMRCHHWRGMQWKVLHTGYSSG